MILSLVCAYLLSISHVQTQRNLALPFSVRTISPKFGCTNVEITEGNVCKDCSTIEFCNEDKISEYEVKCSFQNSLRPYCNPLTRQCDSDSTACIPTGSSFKCKERGYFPDSMDCHRYIFCDKSLNPNTYACLYNGVYDHIKQKCAMIGPCYEFTPNRLCYNNTGKLVVYPPDKSFYAFCPRKGITKLRSCPNKNYMFNASISSCEFVCKEEGNFLDEEDSMSFYACYKKGSNLVATRIQCAPGTIFDKEERTCESI